MPNSDACDSESSAEQAGSQPGTETIRHRMTGLKTGALQDAIFNSAYFSSIATDEQGVIQIFNVGAERMLGYEAADVVNKITPADISDPEELIARAKSLSAELETLIEPGFEALVFKASRGIEDIYDLTYIRKDGSRFPALVSVTSLRDERDAIIGYLLIGTDNTARKQVEAEQKKLDQRIRDQQFYTRSLIESNIDALMTTDPAGIITDVNKQMEALTGCTRDELIGAPFKNYFTDPARAEAAIRLVLSEKKVTNYELTARARDGTEIVVSYNATTFYDRERSLQGVFAAARDVTELKHFERTLQEKNLELEQASRMKSEFLATMSHELRTPLTGMLGMLELLALTPLDGEQAETLQIARDSGHGLVRIINDVLDHAKIEAGKLEINVEPVSISRLLRQVTNTYQAVANAGDLLLIQSVDPRISPALLADPLRVAQILNNLVSNGLKFTMEGHVEVSASLLEHTDTTETIVLTVRDTGIGIHADVQKRLFQPFEQAGAATALLYGGTGLGLSICRRLADLMGGTITVESMPGKGTTMSVMLTLPISAEGSLAEDAATIQPQVKPIFGAEVKGSVPVVLAVDDHPTNRALLTRQLLALGLRVRTAVDGVEGLALWRKGGITLVITDCNMPQMDGYEFTRAMRLIEVDEGRVRTPVIGWTANVLPGTTEQCLAADMDGILIKPADLPTLKASLEEWLPATLLGMLKQAEAGPDMPGVEDKVILAELDKLANTPAERAEILLEFMVQMRTNTAGLDAALQVEDFPACAHICHRMKGAGGMIGASDLTVACTVAEQAARAAKLDKICMAKAAIDIALAQLEVHLAVTTSSGVRK